VELDPPAPAARAELAFGVVFAVARRLTCLAPGGRATVFAAPGRGGTPEGEVGLSESDIFSVTRG